MKFCEQFLFTFPCFLYAEYYYKKIYRNHEDDANVVFSYGEFLIAQNRQKEAMHLFVKAFEGNQIDNGIKVRYLYNALQDEEQFKKVKPLLDTLVKVLLEKAPENLNIMSLYSDVNYRIGNYKASSDILKRIIQKDESNYKAWEQMLFRQSGMDNKDTVINYGIETIRRFENRPLPYLMVASAYYMKDDYRQALNFLERGEKYADSDPLKVEYYSLLAECYSKENNQELSDQFYERALKLDSVNLGILNNYAYSLAVRGDKLQMAKQMSGFTIRNDPESSTFLDTYAWVLFKNKEVRKAIIYIRKALEKGGNKNPEILEHYGDMMIKRGKGKKAIEIYKEAIGYGDENVRKRLEEKIIEVGKRR